MLRLIGLLKPPEWRWWRWIDRAAYLVSLAAFMAMMMLGGWKLTELLDATWPG